MRLKELRLKTGLEPKDFGAYCGGIPENTIKKWESNYGNPKPYVKKLIIYRVEHPDYAILNFEETTMHIREIRKLTGLTQKEFANKNDIPLRTLENWESDKRTPPIYINRLLQFKCITERLIK